jgi:hypothetical protein
MYAEAGLDANAITTRVLSLFDDAELRQAGSAAC